MDVGFEVGGVCDGMPGEMALVGPAVVPVAFETADYEVGAEEAEAGIAVLKDGRMEDGMAIHVHFGEGGVSVACSVGHAY